MACEAIDRDDSVAMIQIVRRLIKNVTPFFRLTSFVFREKVYCICPENSLPSREKDVT